MFTKKILKYLMKLFDSSPRNENLNLLVQVKIYCSWDRGPALIVRTVIVWKIEIKTDHALTLIT